MQAQDGVGGRPWIRPNEAPEIRFTLPGLVKEAEKARGSSDSWDFALRGVARSCGLWGECVKMRLISTRMASQ